MGLIVHVTLHMIFDRMFSVKSDSILTIGIKARWRLLLFNVLAILKINAGSSPNSTTVIDFWWPDLQPDCTAPGRRKCRSVVGGEVVEAGAAVVNARIFATVQARVAAKRDRFNLLWEIDRSRRERRVSLRCRICGTETGDG